MLQTIVKSGKTRTVFLPVMEQFENDKPESKFESELYDADLDTVLYVISHYTSEQYTLLIIGHNPAMDEVYNYLTRNPAPYNAKGKLLTTSSIAILSYKDKTNAIKKNSATTEVLIRPKELS